VPLPININMQGNNIIEENSLKSRVIKKWVSQGMQEDVAELKWGIIYNDIQVMQTPDRYDVSEEQELWHFLRFMYEFSVKAQQYTVRLLDNKGFRKKNKNIRKPLSMVKKVLADMRSKNTRFRWRSHMQYISDLWLQDTIEYACTNVGLRNGGHIDSVELNKRCRSAIFKMHKNSPLSIDYDKGTVSIPNVDGIKKITLTIPGLIKRDSLRNLRLIEVEDQKLLLNVHHLDHNKKDQVERQKLIAQRAGIEYEEYVIDQRDAPMETKSDLNDLFGD